MLLEDELGTINLIISPPGARPLPAGGALRAARVRLGRLEAAARARQT